VNDIQSARHLLNKVIHFETKPVQLDMHDRLVLLNAVPREPNSKEPPVAAGKDPNYLRQLGSPPPGSYRKRVSGRRASKRTKTHKDTDNFLVTAMHC
jgi:hypothetical protein